MSTEPTCSPRRPRVPPKTHVFPRLGRPPTAAQVQGRSDCPARSASSMWPYANCVSGRTAVPASARTAVAALPVLTGVGASPPLFWAFRVSDITGSHLRVEPGWDRRQSEQRPASRTAKSLARSGQRANHSLKLTGRPLRDRLRQPGRRIQCRWTGVAGPQLSSTVRRSRGTSCDRKSSSSSCGPSLSVWQRR